MCLVFTPGVETYRSDGLVELSTMLAIVTHWGSTEISAGMTQILWDI